MARTSTKLDDNTVRRTETEDVTKTQLEVRKLLLEEEIARQQTLLTSITDELALLTR